MIMGKAQHRRVFVTGVLSTLFVFVAYSYVVFTAGLDDIATAWFILLGLGIAVTNLAAFILVQRRLTARGK